MVLLGNEAQLKAHFGRVGDSGNIDTRWVHGLRRTFHRLGVRLEIVVILTQDGCMVCAERTIGSEIILDAPDGTPR